MNKVEIYSTKSCSYCVRAKQLLNDKGIAYTEILVDEDPEKLTEMMQRSGGKRSVPQIFINDQHIGGYDDLYAKQQAGELDGLLE